MRTAFIEELTRLAELNEKIFLVVGDLGFSVVEKFASRFPDRFLNAGIAEQNMTGLAAGLASEGYHVFTYSIANFPTFRCAEQIRNDVAYHGLPVTIASVGGGLAYGSLGYSHHAVQDYALLRTFPRLRILAPGDPLETAASLRFLSANPQPSYLRLGKAGEPVVHLEPVSIAAGELLFPFGRNGGNLLLTTGAALHLASKALEDGPSGWTLASLPVWGESDKARIAAHLSAFQNILSVEDHLRSGGFGSFLNEALSDYGHWAGTLKSIALSHDVCGMVAGQEALNKAGGLSVEAIRNALTAEHRCKR